MYHTTEILHRLVRQRKTLGRCYVSDNSYVKFSPNGEIVDQFWHILAE